jgi:acetolactate synthase-1/2/3 large subunit
MPKLYEALAEAFLAEGVDTQFVLLGDSNMHWSTTFAKLPGVHTVHDRLPPRGPVKRAPAGA